MRARNTYDVYKNKELIGADLTSKESSELCGLDSGQISNYARHKLIYKKDNNKYNFIIATEVKRVSPEPRKDRPEKTILFWSEYDIDRWDKYRKKLNPNAKMVAYEEK